MKLRHVFALIAFVAVACLAHARPDYRSNFQALRLDPQSKILRDRADEPYTGRLVARDAEIVALAEFVAPNALPVPRRELDPSGLIVVAHVDQGRLEGQAVLYADSSSDVIMDEVTARVGDVVPLARELLPAVEIGRASFVAGELHGPATISVNVGEPMPVRRLFDATYVNGRIEGRVRQYAQGSNDVRREITFLNGVPSGTERRYFDSGKVAETLTHVDGALHGERIAYYEDGSLRAKSTYEAGRPVGERRRWFPDGTLASRVSVEHGLTSVEQWYSNGALKLRSWPGGEEQFPPEGVVVEHYATGVVRSRIRYDDGVGNGPFEVFYSDGTRWETGTLVAGVHEGTHEKRWKNGRLALRAHYVRGRLEGEYRRDYANGERWERATYRNGKRTGPYRKWWKNGAIAHDYAYEGGKLHGPYRTYYDTGAKWAVGEYRNGKPLGLHRRWFPDGLLGYIKHHANGRPHGAVKRWYADGTLRLDATYVEGKLHGEFRNWLEDGSVYEFAFYDRGKQVRSTRAEPPRGSKPATYALRPGETRLDDAELQTSHGAFRVGMRVKMRARDRALDPEETGHRNRVALGPGQTGEVVGFIQRSAQSYTFNMVIVRWDAQTWAEWDIPLNRMEEGKAYSASDLDELDRAGDSVQLPAFELPTHPDFLAVP